MQVKYLQLRIAKPKRLAVFSNPHTMESVPSSLLSPYGDRSEHDHVNQADAGHVGSLARGEQEHNIGTAGDPLHGHKL